MRASTETEVEHVTSSSATDASSDATTRRRAEADRQEHSSGPPVDGGPRSGTRNSERKLRCDDEQAGVAPSDNRMCDGAVSVSVLNRSVGRIAAASAP